MTIYRVHPVKWLIVPLLAGLLGCGPGCRSEAAEPDSDSDGDLAVAPISTTMANTTWTCDFVWLWEGREKRVAHTWVFTDDTVATDLAPRLVDLVNAGPLDDGLGEDGTLTVWEAQFIFADFIDTKWVSGTTYRATIRSGIEREVPVPWVGVGSTTLLIQFAPSGGVGIHGERWTIERYTADRAVFQFYNASTQTIDCQRDD